jgi:hypothetical protein
MENIVRDKLRGKTKCLEKYTKQSAKKLIITEQLAKIK